MDGIAPGGSVVGVVADYPDLLTNATGLETGCFSHPPPDRQG
jgi:hypothetical protein